MRQLLRFIVCLVFLLCSVSLTAYAQSEEGQGENAETAEAAQEGTEAGTADEGESDAGAQDEGAAAEADDSGDSAEKSGESEKPTAVAVENDKSKENGGDDAVSAYLDFVIALEACGTFSDPEDANYRRPPVCTGELSKSERAELARDNPKCLPECDIDKIYNALDVETRNAIVIAYATLVKIDTIIETYFDSIEHSHMRMRTGTNILKDAEHPVKSASDLFKHLFKPEKLIINKHVISGLQFVEKKEINKTSVSILTHMSGQEFRMTQNAQGVWQTNALLNAISLAIDPILVSGDEMQKYAKDNIAEEYARREAVRDYFLEQSKLRELMAQQLMKKQAKGAE